MKKTWKRLCTGFLALATVVTALPTTPVHAESKQYWTESKERVGIVEKVMNDGSIGSTFNGVFSDKDCTKQLATLTTDENGNTDIVEVKAGTVYRFSNLCNNTLYFLVCRTLSSYAIFVLYKTSYYVDIVCNTTLSYFHTCWFQFRQKCIYGHRYCRKFIICIASYRTWRFYLEIPAVGLGCTIYGLLCFKIC